MTISTLQRQELESHQWRVFSRHTKTREAITQLLQNKQEIPFHYDGKPIPVFVTDFKVVEFLVNNHPNILFQFTAYHRKSDAMPWRMWKEGEGITTKLKENKFNHLTFGKQGVLK